MSYESWLLETDQKRFLLAEVDFRDPSTGTTVTSYFGTESRIHLDLAVTNRVLYEGRLSRRTYHRRTLPNMFGGLALTEVGSLVINNADGKYDYLLDEGYDPRQIRYIHGGPGLAKADWAVYYLQGKSLGAVDKNYLEIPLSDTTKHLENAFCKLEEISGSVAEGEKIANNYGECHFIEPVLYAETVTGVFFRVSDKTCSDTVVNMFFDGVIRNSYVSAESPTTFTVLKSNYNNEQVSVRSVGSLINGIASRDLGEIVEDIVTAEGISVDATSVSQTSTARPYDIGLYERSDRSTKEVLSEVCESENLIITSDIDGTVFIKPIEFGTSVTTLRATKILKGSLSISASFDPVWKIRVGAAKRWSPVRNPDQSLSVAELSFRTARISWSSTEDSTVKDNYNDAKEKSVESLMTNVADAPAEATRRLNFYKTRMYQYSMTAFGTVNQVNIGDTFTVVHPRINSGNPKDLICISLETEFVSNKINIVGVG